MITLNAIIPRNAAPSSKNPTFKLSQSPSNPTKGKPSEASGGITQGDGKSGVPRPAAATGLVNASGSTNGMRADTKRHDLRSKAPLILGR